VAPELQSLIVGGAIFGSRDEQHLSMCYQLSSDKSTAPQCVTTTSVTKASADQKLALSKNPKLLAQ